MTDGSDAHQGISIHPMRVDDIRGLHSLWDLAGLKYHPKGRDSRANLQDEWMANPDGFIGAFTGDRMVGCVIATDDGRRGWINRLAVHPEHRRGGLAGRLITAAEQEFRRRGLRVTAALIDKENVSSQALFSQSGYRFHKDILYYSKRESDDA